jgi:hypothetical protein
LFIVFTSLRLNVTAKDAKSAKDGNGFEGNGKNNGNAWSTSVAVLSILSFQFSVLSVAPSFALFASFAVSQRL